MTLHRYVLMFLTVAASLLAALPCHARKKPVKKPVAAAVTVTPLSDNDQKRYDYFYLQAICMQEKEDYAAAYDLLLHCLEINPDAAEAFFTLSNYDAALGQDSLMLAHMRRAVALDPENDAYAERLGQTYLKLQDYEQAVGLYESLAEAHPSRSDVLHILGRLYQQQKNYPKVIETLNRLEIIEGSSEDISLAKMQMYSLQGRKKEEFRELRQLAQKHPSDYNYRVMMGNWLLKNGKPKEALAEYNAVLKKEPDNYAAMESLLDYYKSQQQDSLARVKTEELLVSTKTPSETKRRLISQVVMENEQQGGDSVKVLNLFDKILSQPQEDAEMASWRAVYMKLKKMPVDAQMEAWERVLAIDPADKASRLETLQLAIRQQDFARSAEICQRGADYNPDEMVFYYYLGLSHFQMDHLDEALEAFRRGVSQINSESNPDIVSDFYAIMGDILHTKHLDAEAFAAYDSCLQWKADNIGCLNNYAYYLSLGDTDLSRAEKMSYRTIKAEPANSTYLDTYAWILFRQGRYEEARIYIDQALRNDSTHSAVLIEHAGDIYAMCGETERAVEYWQQALEKGEGSLLLQRKIKLRKYVE